MEAALRIAATALVILVAAACSGDAGGKKGVSERIPASCGLPTPEPNPSPEIVPDAFVGEVGGELVQADPGAGGGLIAVVNLARSVNDALKTYKDAIRAGGYDVVQEENEGFEAEIYFQRGKTIGLVQIRQSLCLDATVAFINMTSTTATMPSPSATLPSPTGK